MNFSRRLNILFTLSIFISCTYEKQKEADNLIKIIADYQNVYKKVPNSLSEIGFVEKEEDSIYYLKKSDSTYIIWYGTRLGESMVYNSLSKKWESDRQ